MVLKALALGCMIGMIALTSLPVAAQPRVRDQVTIESSAEGKRYLAYGGRPLLAFGPGDESRLISRSDFAATRRWAKWQRDNGMNLVRAYPTSVPLPDALHPFKMKNGKWDVDAWNDEYFRNMSRYVSVLEEYGIMLHLQVWQICWFKEDRPDRWARNYLNPANNCNEWTRAYPHGRDYMNAPADTPAGRHRRQWVMRVLDAVKGHGNVWIDVINELGNAGIGDFAWAHDVVSWIREWEDKNGQKLLVGVDMCSFDPRQFGAFEKDYDLLIFNELHRDEALAAIKAFRKPAASVRSSDGSNMPGDYIFTLPGTMTPEHQTRYRTLCYRSVFSGLQSIGAYWKPEVSEADYADMKDWPAYAKALRKFWEKIGRFCPELTVDDSIVDGAITSFAYGLKSDRLYCVYLECGPAAAGKQYPASMLRITCPFRDFRIEIFDPRTGKSTPGKGTKANGQIALQLPGFMEDLVVMVWRRGRM